MKKMLLLGVLIILSSFVSADCVIPTDGMNIKEDTTFCEGTYNLSKEIIVSGINGMVLDCNNAELITGKRANMVIKVIGRNATIKNCKISDSWYGIYERSGPNNKFISNTFKNIENVGINFVGYADYSENYLIENNTFIDTRIAVSLSKTTDVIIQNNLFDGVDYGITFGVLSGDSYVNNIDISFNEFHTNIMGVIIYNGTYNNSIWGNAFYNKGIFDSFEINNIYCVSCIDNNYFDGATGPTCPSSCDDLDNDGIPNSEDKCPNTELPEMFEELKGKRYGDIDGDGIFETRKKSKFPVIDSEYSLTDTDGCSCKQILEFKSKGIKKELKSGCKKSTIKTFIEKKKLAEDLF